MSRVLAKMLQRREAFKAMGFEETCRHVTLRGQGTQHPHYARQVKLPCDKQSPRQCSNRTAAPLHILEVCNTLLPSLPLLYPAPPNSNNCCTLTHPPCHPAVVAPACLRCLYPSPSHPSCFPAAPPPRAGQLSAPLPAPTAPRAPLHLLPLLLLQDVLEVVLHVLHHHEDAVTTTNNNLGDTRVSVCVSKYALRTYKPQSAPEESASPTEELSSLLGTDVERMLSRFLYKRYFCVCMGGGGDKVG